MKPIHIVYVMTWTGICGGSKIIFEHCNLLVNLGQKVTIMCNAPRPDWFAIDARVGFVDMSKTPSCDLIVVTYWRELGLFKGVGVPVVYFEQGDVHLFAPETFDAGSLGFIKKQISLPRYVFTVSNFAREKLRETFGVSAHVIPNAIDKGVFFHAKKRRRRATVITAIGSQFVYFKCIPNIISAVAVLKTKGYNIEFNWISPHTPTIANTTAIVNPPQTTIGDVLRRTDIYVCASLFESFCLPVLEAMTCGAAVVTTDNGGIRDFARDYYNCVIIEKNNVADMVAKIEMIINDPKLRARLVQNGAKTARQFDWAVVGEGLIKYYRAIVHEFSRTAIN